MTRHEDVQILLAAYALDSVDEGDLRAVESHVARCTNCHAELQSLLRTGEALADAPRQFAPPSTLRQRILDDALALDTTSAHVPAIRGARRWKLFPDMSKLMQPAVAASLAALVIVSGIATQQFQRARTLDRQIARDRSAVAAGARPSPTSMIGTSGTHTVATSGMLKSAHMELVDVHGAGMLVAKDLPPAPAGYEWRVWGVAPGHDMHAMGKIDHVRNAPNGMQIQSIGSMKNADLTAVVITVVRSSAPHSVVGEEVGRVTMA